MRCHALGTRGYQRGVHYWEVQVDSLQWGNVFIGVSLLEGSGWNGYGLVNYRATQMYGTETMYGAYYREGDIVGVLLDLDRGTISFSKEGHDPMGDGYADTNMGIAYHFLRKNHRGSPLGYYYPCLGVKSSIDRLSIRNNRYASLNGLKTNTLLQRLLDSKQFISKWPGLYSTKESLSVHITALLPKIYRKYVAWIKSHTTVVVQTKTGILKSISTDVMKLKVACGSVADIFHIHIGMKIYSSYGKVEIIGASNKLIWYQSDGSDRSIWCWTREQLLKALTDENVKIIEANKSEFETLESNNMDNNQIMSEDTFKRCLFGANNIPWTTGEDELLIQNLNTISNKLNINPLRIKFSNIKIWKEENLITLPNRGIDEITARYIALSVLNNAMMYALPLIDFARWPTNILLYTKFDQQIMDVFSSGHELGYYNHATKSFLHNKSLLFTRIKLDFWELALKDTTTPTVPNPDEFEKPEDFKIIELNRVEANAVRNNHSMNLSFDEKLKRSLFGQLLQLTKSWDEKIFRKSYTHTQDVGQARSFYVKLLGEGVYDNGGPYRATFETAIGEDALFLGLLTLCPNAMDDMSNNRDLYTINTKLNNTNLDLIRHLGKLIGVAKRHDILSPVSIVPLVWKSLIGEILTNFDLLNIDTFTSHTLDIIAKGGDLDAEEMMEILTNILKCLIDVSPQVEVLISLLNSSQSIQNSSSASDSTLNTRIPQSIKIENESIVTQQRSGSHHSMSMNMNHNNSNNNINMIEEECEDEDYCDDDDMEALFHYFNNNNSNNEDFISRIQSSSSSKLRSKICNVIKHLLLVKYRKYILNLYEGMSISLPMEISSIFTTKEFEVFICGEVQVDLELLKRITEYEGVSSTDM